MSGRLLMVATAVALPLATASADEVAETRDAALDKWNAEVVAEIRRKKVRHVVISKAAVARLKSEPLRLLKLVRVVPAIRDGQAAGFKVFGIRAGSIPAALGLRNGDVIDQVNAMPVRDAEEGMAAYRKIASARRLHVRLQRRGKPVYLRIDVGK